MEPLRTPTFIGDVATVVAEIRATLNRADGHYDAAYVYHTGDEFDEGNFQWYMEIAFLQLIVLSESLGLNTLRSELSDLFATAKRVGLTKAETGPEERFSKWVSELRQHVSALETLIGASTSHQITKDIDAILRASNYSINDSRVFALPPSGESELHVRIEAILRCVFPDLLTKPRLSKPIKSFEPDTGLPSIKTLVEYKFLSSSADVNRVADEVLADTRGYESEEWDKFVYVVYETRRLRPEREWNSFLRKCRVPSNANIVVLSGQEPRQTRRKSLQGPRRSAM